jgi:hypothetical protein
MNAITSLYIAHVDKRFNAEYIADVFSKNSLAQVSRVYLKSNINYNRAYIQLDSWQETEAAYSFIQRLRNPGAEARLVYSDDNWWTVEINKYPAVFTSNNRLLTVFTKPIEVDEVDDESSNVAVGDAEEYEPEEIVMIDAEKTKMIRDIVAKFKENYEKEKEFEEFYEKISRQFELEFQNQECELMEQEEADSAEYEAYLREMDWVRNVFRREVTSDLWDETFWY